MDIVALTKNEQKEVNALYKAVTKDLRSRGIDQWDWFYPNRFIFGNDLRRGHMFGYRQGKDIIGAVVVDANQNRQYQAFDWKDAEGTPACIHRLAVHPAHQGYGLGKQLLQFAEQLAGQRGHTSIRLEVYKGNPAVANMYRRSGYMEVGEIKYPFRKQPYLCMEKLL